MTLEMQKSLRFIIPGIILYFLLVIFCWTTNWCALSFPTSVEDASTLLAAIVFGFLYAVTGLRNLSNSFYHEKVKVNISKILTTPFKHEIPEVESLGWSEIRPIFYDIIDNDNSLQKQSNIIRLNGLMWTSAADLRVCCIIGILLFSGVLIFDEIIMPLTFDHSRIGYSISGLTVLFLLSFWLSARLTREHKRLGTEQCEQILVHFRKKLAEKLSEASTVKS